MGLPTDFTAVGSAAGRKEWSIAVARLLSAGHLLQRRLNF